MEFRLGELASAARKTRRDGPRSPNETRDFLDFPRPLSRQENPRQNWTKHSSLRSKLRKDKSRGLQATSRISLNFFMVG